MYYILHYFRQMVVHSPWSSLWHKRNVIFSAISSVMVEQSQTYCFSHPLCLNLCQLWRQTGGGFAQWMSCSWFRRRNSPTQKSLSGVDWYPGLQAHWYFPIRLTQRPFLHRFRLRSHSLMSVWKTKREGEFKLLNPLTFQQCCMQTGGYDVRNVYISTWDKTKNQRVIRQKL